MIATRSSTAVLDVQGLSFTNPDLLDKISDLTKILWIYLCIVVPGLNLFNVKTNLFPPFCL